MHKRAQVFYLQLILTLFTCAFLVVPIVQSILAGITVNYFQGLKSGLTLQWMVEVWRLYADTIFRSLLIGLVCLGIDLLVGVPAAYAMVKSDSKFTRIIEEFLAWISHQVCN